MKGPLRLALVVVLLIVAPTLALAAAGPRVAIDSPQEGLTLSSQTVGVEATFAAADGARVVLVELAIDGAIVDTRRLDPAAAEGQVSFTWIAGDYGKGRHRLAVRATDSEGLVGTKGITVWLAGARPVPAGGVRISSPGDGETVSGSATIQVEVDDPRLARYVIFLVDDVFRAMTNVRPFTYVWDTTRHLNGSYTLKAKAASGGEWEALSAPIRVTVDNPSGATAMRPPTLSMQPVAPIPMTRPARAGEPALPPARHTESATALHPPDLLSHAQLAVPGTAPFVSESGQLIRPPAPPPSDIARAAVPFEIAVVPTFAEPGLAAAPRLPAAGPEPVPSRAAGAHTPAAATPAPAVPSSFAPAAARPPAQAPLVIALLQGAEGPVAPLAPPAHAGDAAPLAAAGPSGEMARADREPSPAPLQVALLPSPEPAPAASPMQASPAPAGAAVASAFQADARALDHRPAAPSPITVAMLPPRPAEVVPAPRLAAEPAPTDTVYVVRSGDSLYRIAASLGVSPGELARANSLANPSLLKPGQVLQVPGARVYLDGRPLAADAPAFVAEGRAMVAFRPLIEQAGGRVAWDGAQRRATAIARGREISVTIGSDEACVDGSPVAMQAPAEIRSDRTIVPVRFLGDALDVALQYQDGIIHIASVR